MSFASTAGARIPHVATPAPVLLMHFDGDFVDAMGITTFTSNVSTFETGSSGFGQRAAVTGGTAHIFGSSSQELSIGTRQFTIEGRCMFASGQTGGVVLSKNYWGAEPAPGVFKHDFTVKVTPSLLTFEWENVVETYNASISTTADQEFHWAISDDGVSMRFYANGTLVGTSPSASLAAVTPPETVGSGITVLGMIQGFLGPNPDWVTSFVGRCDELVMWLGYAKYTGSSYTVPSAPYTP